MSYIIVRICLTVFFIGCQNCRESKKQSPVRCMSDIIVRICLTVYFIGCQNCRERKKGSVC